MLPSNPTHFDAHCHLGWFEDPVAAAQEAAEAGLGLLAVTVTPNEYRSLRDKLSGEKNVALAAGLHPWWVRDVTDADGLVELLPDLRFVGEIGLDAAPRRAATWEAQLAAFERVCTTCAETSDPAAPKVLSIHAVRSASVVLDVLERTGVASRCRCVLHWFSGTSAELVRARALGCWFSLGERALATRRGREYARQVPANHLLTETDLPAATGESGGVELLRTSLDRAARSIAAARSLTPEVASRLTCENARALLA